jgi:hypothetical protein
MRAKLSDSPAVAKLQVDPPVVAGRLCGGVKFFPSRSLGVRAHFRYKPTFLNDSSSDFCDPFGFCQGVLQQIEFAAAAVLRF